MWVPQAVRAVRHRHQLDVLAGISLVSFTTAIVFNALLLSYGWVSDALPVVLAGAVNLACATVIVAVVLWARRSRP